MPIWHKSSPIWTPRSSYRDVRNRNESGGQKNIAPLSSHRGSFPLSTRVHEQVLPNKIRKAGITKMG
jgi:hypothetical protein